MSNQASPAIHILPCPFCGRKPSLGKGSRRKDGTWLWQPWIHCKQDGITWHDDSLEALVARWNARGATPKIRAGATIHTLKTWPHFWEAIATGRKTFELRLNDRDYQEGDILRLLPWDPNTGEYQRGTIAATVTYTLDGADYGALAPGYIAIGLRVTFVDRTNPNAPTP